MLISEKRGLKILLVEDDLHVRDCFESLLEFDGHQVQAVDGGEAALAMLEHRQFDLVITDYWMPRMMGDQLAALIKQRRPSQPIILATGSLANVTTFDSAVPGVDCLLNKPFSLTELREAINWVMDLYADSQHGGLGIYETLGSNPIERDATKRSPDDHGKL